MFSAKGVVLEALLVAGLGFAVAITANALSSQGLPLGRNYFPEATGSSIVASSGGQATPKLASANEAEPSSAAASRRLQQRGLQPVSHDEIVGLFRDRIVGRRAESSSLE